MRYFNKHTQTNGNITTSKVFMDTRNDLEGISLYVERETTDEEGERVEVEAYPNTGIALTFDRRMAYRLMKEIETRLFGGTRDDIVRGGDIEGPHFTLWR